MSATDELLRPWYERDPARLRWELANFADAGLNARQRIYRGCLLIETLVDISNGRQFDVQVEFPVEYPLADPRINVRPGLIGPPHEVYGRLCLLDNPGAQWHPGRASIEVVHRAQQLLEDALVGGPEKLAKREEPVPLHPSALRAHAPDMAMLVTDPFFAPPPAGLTGGRFGVTTDQHGLFLLAHVEGWAEANSTLLTRVGCGHTAGEGFWAAANSLPLTTNEMQSAFLADPVLAQAMGDGTHWLALTYPEEGAFRGEPARGWSFVEFSEAGPRLVQVQAYTLEQRMLRLPDLAGLESCRFVLVGAGSLGGSVALHLARAGAGNLTIADGDSYDINNSVRHELPARAAATGKAVAVTTQCEAANPFCHVTYVPQQLGANEPRITIDALTGATMVIETTGSDIVTRIMERYCRALGIPLLTGSLTAGARGADVLLLTPDLCFQCYLDAQHSGAIRKPQAGPEHEAVPVGCASPTFAGAGFDAAELAAVIARTAVAGCGTSSYPGLDYNWAVLNFTADPRWEAGIIEPDEGCTHHR